LILKGPVFGKLKVTRRGDEGAEVRLQGDEEVEVGLGYQPEEVDGAFDLVGILAN
jgi:hypothetical protein